MGLFSRIRGRQKHSVTQADKPSSERVPVKHFNVVVKVYDGQSPHDCAGAEQTLAFVKRILDEAYNSDKYEEIRIIPDRNWEAKEREEYLELKAKYELSDLVATDDKANTDVNNPPKTGRPTGQKG